ncbi:hypothetical protein CR513_48730, partial [Mucuna pruriens]
MIHDASIWRLCITRSSSNNLHAFDREIDRTLHRLRKVRSTNLGDSISFIFISNSVNNTFTSNNFDFSDFISFDINFESNIVVNTPHELDLMENNDRTLKELAVLDLEPTQSYKLKFRLINLLSKFHGLASEDPHKHLKEFQVAAWVTRGLHQNESIFVFPRWNHQGLTILIVDSVQHLGDMKQMFLEKFLSASRTTTIQKEICGIRQHSEETLHEYWERFNKLCPTSPHHQINKQLLIQYFYKGLMMMNQNMIDAASDSNSSETPDLEYGEQHATIRGVVTSRVVNKVDTIDNLRLENQLTELTSLVRQLAVRKHQPSVPMRVCGICTSMERPTDMYPMLQETESDNAKIKINSRIRVNSMIVNSSGGSSTDRVQVKGNSDPHKACRFQTRITISSRFRNTKHHRSDNNSNNDSATGQFTFDGIVDEIPTKF